MGGEGEIYHQLCSPAVAIGVFSGAPVDVLFLSFVPQQWPYGYSRGLQLFRLCNSHFYRRKRGGPHLGPLEGLFSESVTQQWPYGYSRGQAATPT